MSIKQNILDIGMIDLKNFNQISSEDKKIYIKILNALRNKDFNSTLLTDDVLDNDDFLYAAIKLNSPHLSKFTCKIKDYFLGLSYLNSENIYINFKYIDEELFKNMDFVKNIVSNKPYFYQRLEKNIQEEEDVFQIYLNSIKCDWNMFPEKYKKQKYGLLAIEKNIFNLPLVMEIFPNLKKKTKLWIAIANFYNEETLNPSDDLETDPSNTPLELLFLIADSLKEKDELTLLKKINELKDTKIPALMINALSYSDCFKKYLANIDIETLNEDENQLQLLRQEILNYHLNQVNDKNKDIKRIKSKI